MSARGRKSARVYWYCSGVVDAPPPQYYKRTHPERKIPACMEYDVANTTPSSKRPKCPDCGERMGVMEEAPGLFG